MQDIRKVLGRNVRELRLALGLSQEELGFKAGLDRTYVSGVERGVRNPTVVVLQKFADALGTEAGRLLDAVGGNDAMCKQKRLGLTK